jgi:hypothetical protein
MAKVEFAKNEVLYGILHVYQPSTPRLKTPKLDQRHLNQRIIPEELFQSLQLSMFPSSRPCRSYS